jgi:hypothetical protein
VPSRHAAVRRSLLVTLASATILAGLALAYRWPWPAERRELAAGPTDLAALRQRVEALEQEAERARDNPHHDYAPRVMGSKDFGRRRVQVGDGVACAKPTHRIIHFRDWHFVPPGLFAEDLADSFGRPPTDEEADLYHRELLLQVERAALAALARYHGLERVLAEGLTAEGLGEFRDVMDRMRTTDRELAGLRKQRAGLKANAEAIDRAIAELVRGHRDQLLPYSAVGRLALDQAVEVLPLDGEATLMAEAISSLTVARHGGVMAACRSSVPWGAPGRLNQSSPGWSCNVLVRRRGGRYAEKVAASGRPLGRGFGGGCSLPVTGTQPVAGTQAARGVFDHPRPPGPRDDRS